MNFVAFKEKNEVYMKFFYLVLCAIFSAFIVFIFTFLQEDTKILKVNNVSIKSEIAVTPSERKLGLSHRKLLKKGRGLLFIFEEEGYHSFWMKDMNFSIDILWIDAKKKIVHIEHSISPKSFPKSFSSKTKSQYVLEIPARYSSENNIKVGDVFKW